MPKTGFKIKFYPNGEFSAGYVSDKRFDMDFEVDPNAGRYGQLWWAQTPELRRWVEERISNEDQDFFGLSNPINSHTRRGLNGISTYGRRLVKNTAHMLQSKYGRSRLSFLTLTLPALSDDEEKQVCLQWSQIVRVYFQRLRRLQISRGLPPGYVAVTEIQPERWKEKKQVGLHLHAVFVGKLRHSEDWYIRPKEFRKDWLAVLSHFVGREVVSESCENVIGVYKSASGYLGKYMSKGSSAVGEVRELKGEEYVPTAWYSASMNLKRAYQRSIVQVWDDEVDLIGRLPLLCQAEVIEHVGLSFVKFGDREYLMGVSGAIRIRKAYSLVPNIARTMPKRTEFLRNMYELEA